MDTLTPTELSTLKEFRKKLEDVLQPKHDDNFLLRWLRARDFNLTEAENMLRKNLIWRENQKIDFILERYNAPEVVEKYWPMGFLTYDKEGCPVWLLRFGSIDMKGLLYSASKSDICSYFTKILEASEKKMREQSKKLGKLIDQHSFLVDFDNFAFYQIVWGPAFQLMASLIKVYEDNYPERLKYVYGINTPAIFHVAFALLRRFYSERTFSKIILMAKDKWQETVFEAIDESQIPAYLGGKLIGPDDDTYCTHLAPAGGTVPRSYYLQESQCLSNEEDAVTLDVGVKSASKVEVFIPESDSILQWEFKTEKHDVAFGVFYKQDEYNENDLVEMVPLERVNCHLVPETGTLVCENEGTYVLKFDNSFSYLRSKTVRFRTEVIPPTTKL